MATFIATGSQSVDMTDLDLFRLTDAADYIRTSTRFVADFGDGDRDTYLGTGFVFDESGVAIAGTVRSIALERDGDPLLTLSGLSLKAADVSEAALTASTADDDALLAGILRGADRITGSSAGDRLLGFSGDDALDGKGGADTLSGGAGRDVLTGGTGRDVMTGGSGRDAFVFTALNHSTTKAADLITDFRSGTDEIVLTGLKTSGDLDFVGRDGFSGEGAEVRFFTRDGAGTANDRTIVEVDANGDGRADLRIDLVGLVALKGGDFDL